MTSQIFFGCINLPVGIIKGLDMQKLRYIFLNLLNIFDKVSYYILFFVAFCTILNLNLFSINPDDYSDEIKNAYKLLRYYSVLLATSTLLFLLKFKYQKLVYIEEVAWGILCLFVPYMLYHLPSVARMYNNDLELTSNINLFCINLLFLPVVSMSSIGKGKKILFLLVVLGLSHIHNIPEFEKITALESCAEGKCEQAIKMGVVKIDNNVIYIPKNDNDM